MRVAITEGALLLTDALARALPAAGDEVVLLAAGPAPDPRHRRWDPARGAIEAPGLDDVDAVVNLYASSPWCRWTPRVRDELRVTRATGTLTIVSALDPGGRCRRFLNLSSTAFYGERGAEALSADAPRGVGFFAEVIATWEASARHAPVPTALLRTPRVLGGAGGYLPLRRQLRGRLGSGLQYVPWVHVDDWTGAVAMLVRSPAEGPVNLTAPEPVTETVFARQLAASSGRGPGLPIPRAVLVARFGREMVDTLLLASTRAVPQVLEELGFTFGCPTLAGALDDLLGGPSGRGAGRSGLGAAV